MKTCKRRGFCCQDVILAESPGLLKTAYEYWKKIKNIDPNFSEIYLIFPMLAFTHENQDEDLPYHYRCKHFTRDENDVPTCSIYQIRPKMCRDFPYYDSVTHLDTSGPLSHYEGCGYNDPD